MVGDRLTKGIRVTRNYIDGIRYSIADRIMRIGSGFGFLSGDDLVLGRKKKHLDINYFVEDPNNGKAYLKVNFKKQSELSKAFGLLKEMATAAHESTNMDHSYLTEDSYYTGDSKSGYTLYVALSLPAEIIDKIPNNFRFTAVKWAASEAFGFTTSEKVPGAITDPEEDPIGFIKRFLGYYVSLISKADTWYTNWSTHATSWGVAVTKEPEAIPTNELKKYLKK